MKNLPYLTAIFIALLIFSTGVIASDNTGNGNNGLGVSNEYRTVKADEFRDILNHPNVFLLDVRTPAEFNYVHIEGAKLIPLELRTSDFDPTFTDVTQTLGYRLADLPKDKNTIILVYCFSGHRSDRACQMIVNNDYTKVYNLDGGLPTWISEGYPVVMQLTKLKDHYPPKP
jgi:rhodanese-related sulfurtransferase